jgi:hypothetical protein
MGAVVAAGLTGEHQRRQQDLRYTEADDQHLKHPRSEFAQPGSRHILVASITHPDGA